MPPRFYASPYKNALVQIGKRDTWYTELPVNTAAATESSDLIKTCTEYWLAQGSASGTLVCSPYEQPGKFGNQAPLSIRASSRAITDFDVSFFEDLIAVGNDNGQVTVHELPALAELENSSGPLAPKAVFTAVHPSGKPISTLYFHPNARGILLVAAGSVIAVYDVLSGSLTPTFTLENGQASQIWSAEWSVDGRLVSATGKDGVLRLWDVRSDQLKPAMEIPSHPGLKASRHVHLSEDQILTTGFSRMREREYSLVDLKSGKVLKTQRVDTDMGVLMPSLDRHRGIVYLAGRGDQTLRAIIVDSAVSASAPFTESTTALPSPVAAIALAPPSVLNLMKAEINRLMLLTSEGVIEARVEVPRRQYIDFHSDLFPPVASKASAQDSTAWLQGGDAQLDLVQQQPGQKQKILARRSNGHVKHEELVNTAAAQQVRPEDKSTAAEALPCVPAAVIPSIAALPSSASAQSSAAKSAARPTFQTSPAGTSQSTNGSASPASQRAPAGATPVAQPSSSSQAPPKLPQPMTRPTATMAEAKTAADGRFNPGWSRKFLLGKTPLKPDYHDVHGLSATMSADAQMLKANRLFMYFPLAGPGGRLGVHPVALKGRLPTQIPSLAAGATIVDFELDPFDETRVYIASDDSKIRVFTSPKEGFEGDRSDAQLILTDAKMDRVNEIKSHPTAKDLLLSVSDDHGNPTARLWNTVTGDCTAVPLPKGGIWSTAWSPDGRLLALATKSKQILLLDVRRPDSLVSCASHDSLRPVRIAWASSSHLLTSGFTRAASRELILYSAELNNLKPLAHETLDVSPAPLFPFADIDTNIIILYSRGERTCQAFEVQPDHSKPFSKLPNFETGTLQAGWAFLPKQRNDVRNVEIISALRLTQSTIEQVSFTVPRAKADCFQDDIFIPTRDTATPALTAQEWLDGKDAPLQLIDLKPVDMKRLSDAPAPPPKVSTRNQIGEIAMTESQKQEAYMDRLFKAAKEDGDEEEVVRNSHAPDDDDW